MGLSACGGIGIRVYLDELDIYKKPKSIGLLKLSFVSTAPYGALMGQICASHYPQNKFSFAQSLFGAFICLIGFCLMDDATSRWTQWWRRSQCPYRKSIKYNINLEYEDLNIEAICLNISIDQTDCLFISYYNPPDLKPN
ncbi:unnamed protein product [Brachionus calyciflorus]|uniref:Uncharacterized protein n=1 Tax=Brachionus calyciflorus TaxID=104777 RepID=A0A814EW14_9BILA|nr:unnamed protein product [Brachionus calyciflorus]